jgi:hypothetical protein
MPLERAISEVFTALFASSPPSSNNDEGGFINHSRRAELALLKTLRQNFLETPPATVCVNSKHYANK